MQGWKALPPEMSPEGRAGRAVSRVLFPRALTREDGHLSGTVVADRLEQPTRGSPLLALGGLLVWVTPRRLFGLAPTGGYRATIRCRWCGGLLPHLFTLTPACARAVSFLWPCPSPGGAQVLPGSLPCGARTFLGTEPVPRPPRSTRA